jgi:hypothetical protein
MRIRRHILGIAFLLPFALISLPSHADEINKIAAVVGEVVVTLRDIEVEGKLEAIEREGEMSLVYPLTTAQNEVTRERLIERILILGEARKVEFEDPSEADIQVGMLNFRRKFSSEKSFQAFMKKEDLTLQDIRERMRDVLKAARYTGLKVGKDIKLGDGALGNYFNSHRGEYPNMTFEQAKPSISDILAASAMRKRFDDWIDELKRGAEIKRLSLTIEEPGRKAAGVRK